MSLGPFCADTIIYLALPEATVVTHDFSASIIDAATLVLEIWCCKIDPDALLSHLRLDNWIPAILNNVLNVLENSIGAWNEIITWGPGHGF